MTLVNRLDKLCPPFIAVALARDEKGKWMPLTAIADASGISTRTVYRIGVSVSWARYMRYASDFLDACGVDPFQMGRQRAYIRETLQSGDPFSYVPMHYRAGFLSRLAALMKKHQATLAAMEESPAAPAQPPSRSRA